METTKLSLWVIELLSTCPQTGGGVHRWIYVTALKLHEHFADKDELAQLLADATTNCGREVESREIEAAIRDSQRWLDGGGAASPERAGQSPWPPPSEEAIQAIVQGGAKLDDLMDASPVRFNDDKRHTGEIIATLFPGNPLLCVGSSESYFSTARWGRMRNMMAQMQFIVPSPMTKKFGRTKDGESSMHTESNTGPRKFLVTECDFGEPNQQAAVILHLARRAPLAMVVHSGGKSLHSWWPCSGQDETELRQFMWDAVYLGADFKTWQKSQFVRMPDGCRDNGKRQKVLFFNPGVLGG